MPFMFLNFKKNQSYLEGRLQHFSSALKCANEENLPSLPLIILGIAPPFCCMLIPRLTRSVCVYLYRGVLSDDECIPGMCAPRGFRRCHSPERNFPYILFGFSSYYSLSFLMLPRLFKSKTEPVFSAGASINSKFLLLECLFS